MSERNVHRPNYDELNGGTEDYSKSDRDESRPTKYRQVSTDKGNNGTMSKAKSSAEPPRRMKREAIVMSSSSSDDGELKLRNDVNSRGGEGTRDVI